MAHCQQLFSSSHKQGRPIHERGFTAVINAPLQPHRHQQGMKHRSRCAARAAGGSTPGKSREGEIWDQLGKMADKYLLPGASGSSAAGMSRRSSSSSPLPPQAIHVLLSCYVVVWLLTTAPITSSGPLLPPKLLSLDLMASSSSAFLSKAVCWATDALLSPSSALLARNLFFGYMFGRVVENTESSGALWLTFALSALGGSASSLLLLPRRVSLQGCAATAGLFGLFAAATLFNRHKHWHWQRVFELLVLLPFVVQQLLQGHQGLSCACSLAGLKVPGVYVPLLGGCVGAAAAAGVLVVVRALQSSITAQRQQEPAQQRQQQLGAGDGGTADLPLSVLLARAAAQLLSKGLRGN